MSELQNVGLIPRSQLIQYITFAVSIVLLLVLIYKWYCHEKREYRYGPSRYEHRGRRYDRDSDYECPMKRQPSLESIKYRDRSRRRRRLSEHELHEGFLNYGDGTPEQIESYDPAKESLEQSVFDSHKEFVDESYDSTQGPSSANVIRDDTNEVVKRWGLRRVDYTGAFSESDARTVSSEYPEQVAQQTGSYSI